MAKRVMNIRIVNMDTGESRIVYNRYDLPKDSTERRVWDLVFEMEDTITMGCITGIPEWEEI